MKFIALENFQKSLKLEMLFFAFQLKKCEQGSTEKFGLILSHKMVFS